jgi:hypothetical protein
MTKKLEELFNLPASDAEYDTVSARELIEQNQHTITDVDSAIDKIDAALPRVKSLDTGDEELDELAQLAKTTAEDLVDLGMNVDPRFAGVILQTAGTMLGHAITAKTAKLDKKLKMVSLQLQKAKMDHQIKKDNRVPGDSDGDDAVDGEGIILDRNELLKRLAGDAAK